MSNKLRSLYFGNQSLPENYGISEITKDSGKAPNAYHIHSPAGDNSWAAGLTLATSNWDNFNPFYWSRVFAGEEEPEKKREKASYFRKPDDFIRRVYNKGHRIPAELIGEDMVYIEGTKALFFDIWRTVNPRSKVYTGGLELSLRRTPGTGKSILGGDYKQYFIQADEFMKKAVEKEKKQEGKRFNAYEDFRRLLPYAYLTYGSLIFNNRYMGKIGKHVLESPVKEFKTLGESISSYVEENSGFELDEEAEADDIRFGELSGSLPLEPKHGLEYRTRASLVILHQLIRNRQNNLDNFSITENVMPSPSIYNFDELKQEFDEILEQSKQIMPKYRENKETAIYSALVGQITEADIRFPNVSSLQDFLDVRDCNQAQDEAQSIGWGLRRATKQQGIKTSIRCSSEPTCPEFSHIKNMDRRIKQWQECMGKKNKTGRELFEFHKGQLESFLQQ